MAASSSQEFQIQSRTRTIELLVPFRFRSSRERVPQCVANFGIGALDMCTSIIEIARVEGMAKRGDQWFPLSQAVVAYDHARHAPLGDVITLDFINTDLEPGARAGIELTLESARELRAALDRAIAAAEFEEAEVRGKGTLPSLVRAA